LAAAQFSLGSICGAASGGVNTEWLALLVIIVTMAILAITLMISVLDMRAWALDFTWNGITELGCSQSPTCSW
jgi:hypothetical protein